MVKLASAVAVTGRSGFGMLSLIGMLHILLAEDNVGDVLLIRRSLDEHQIDHNLHIVRDGAAALAFVAGIGDPDAPPCPDLMLLDLNLPKVDGAGVLAEFRKHPRCVRTPVIVVSSSNAERDRSRVAELGIAQYFRKPSDVDQFMRLGAIVRAVTEKIAITNAAHSAFFVKIADPAHAGRSGEDFKTER